MYGAPVDLRLPNITVPEADVAALLDLAGVALQQQALLDAPVFSLRQKRESVDESFRRTKKCAFHSNDIQTILSRVLAEQASGQEWNFRVLSTDVTYLRYDQGDFFKPHRDFAKVTIPDRLHGYTLIVGLHLSLIHI